MVAEAAVEKNGVKKSVQGVNAREGQNNSNVRGGNSREKQNRWNAREDWDSIEDGNARKGQHDGDYGGSSGRKDVRRGEISSAPQSNLFRCVLPVAKKIGDDKAMETLFQMRKPCCCLGIWYNMLHERMAMGKD